MSLKTNIEYIRDWVNAKFLRKSEIKSYYTKEEIDNTIDEVRVDTNLYLSKEEYETEEEIIASALTDLDQRIVNLKDETDAEGFLGKDEEKVIAMALSDLNRRVSSALDSPTFTGTPTAPTATSGTNTTQIATTAFVSNEIPIRGVSLNGVAGSINNKVANVTLTKSSTGAGNIVTDVSIDGTVITVNKSNLPFKANSGSTRPSLASADIGYVFLDTSLGKPIWWNGSAWIDATGATV